SPKVSAGRGRLRAGAALRRVRRAQPPAHSPKVSAGRGRLRAGAALRRVRRAQPPA
ncbi:unnamed protein product, partial [Coccothraustes coccothraustes]